MINLLIALGIVVLGKFFLNLSKYQACKRYYKIYRSYLANPKWDFLEVQPQIVKLFKAAKIDDNAVAYVENVGYGKILADANVSVMANIGNTREDVVSSVTAMFHKAIGTYRSRMIEAINPLYWLEFIIFMPKSVFEYFGVPTESIFIKIAQAIYWLFASVIGLLYSVFGNEINAYIKELILSQMNIN